MNIYDIAKEAGVSISTVSRVLNNKGYVNADTKQKIESVLKKYDYRPSAIARGLVAKSMKTIGILTIDVRVSHYARTAYIIEQFFSDHGYNVIVCNTGGSMEKNYKYIKNLREMHVDGIVLIGSIFNEIKNNKEILSNLENVPIVLANGSLDIPNAYSILVDDMMGIKLAVDHLYAKGHRDILYVKDLYTESAARKEKSFIDSMKLYEIDAKKMIFKTEYGLEGGKKAAQEIIKSKKKFTAVVFAEDLTAVGAIKEFKKAGLRVPQDVAVTGYNNSEYAVIYEPELTTVENKAETVGIYIAQLLDSLIQEKGNYASIVIQPELVIREST